jgi:hypothetical protein
MTESCRCSLNGCRTQISRIRRSEPGRLRTDREVALVRPHVRSKVAGHVRGVPCTVHAPALVLQASSGEPRARRCRYAGVIVVPFFEMANTLVPASGAPEAPLTPEGGVPTTVSLPPVEKGWVPINFRSTISLPAA